MKTKIGNYIIIDKHFKNLKDVEKRVYLDIIFKFINDKTIEILEWDNSKNRIKIKKYYPYNEDLEYIISIRGGSNCKKEYLSEKFKKFLQKKGKDIVKDFYEAKKKYESLLEKQVEDTYTYHYLSFNNISFEIENISIYNNLISLNTFIDGESKKNSLITHFYYRETKDWDYIISADLYIQLVKLVDSIMGKFESSGFNKYDFYFDIDINHNGNDWGYLIHCVPIEPKPIDNNWFYILSFYTSVLLEYFIKNSFNTINDCYKYNSDLFHKDMDHYDIMNILIEKNNIGG